MNRPLTDKERILHLEAQVASLTEELDAWRANHRDDANAIVRLDRWSTARNWLRQHGHKAATSGADLLICFLQTPGRLLPFARLIDALGRDADALLDLRASVSVEIWKLRRALEVAGYAGAVRNVWGQGYVFEASVAREIEMRLAEDRA